jgi:AcrR family transcriptional regulator
MTMSTAKTRAPAATGGRGARERILKATAELFARDGIHATGVAKVTEVAHVSTRTLYQHFPSKEALVSAYLERLASAPDGPAGIESVLLQEDLAPRDRLVALFAVPPGDQRSARVIRGCPFHNTAVEGAGLLPEAAAFVERHKRRLTDSIVATARAAGAVDPEALGRQLAVVFEGARALATSLNDLRPFEDARDLAIGLIDAALPARPDRSASAAAKKRPVRREPTSTPKAAE